MRMLRETLALLFLGACLDSAAAARTCSSFFCRKSHRVSGLNGVDPGSPLFITPYLEKGAIDEARELSMVGNMSGANVKSYAGYFTVNKSYNSNLFFWFFPAYMVSSASSSTLSMFSRHFTFNPSVISECLH
ncbi:hypothetical protein AMECASPLE_026348 [Ameca splendens]|uniref:Uncharacterized protein n=1 Tax=Ameca splendens TaxID=208324 RepID=A0ABV0ZRP6_9TELE